MLRMLLLILFVPGLLIAQVPVRVIGVFDSRTGKPVPGVQVRDAFSGTYAMTSVTGTAPLGFITFRGAAGVVELRKLGYEAKRVVIAAGDTTSITELLDPVVSLPAVVTTERYRIDQDSGRWAGFDQRCAQAHTQCLRDEFLSTHVTWTLAEALRGVGGVHVACSGPGTNRSRNRDASMPSCTVVGDGDCSASCPGCYPKYFVDGLLFEPAGPTERPMTYAIVQSMVGPAQLKGVEVYRWNQAMPARFQTGCTAVVLWTK